MIYLLMEWARQQNEAAASGLKPFAECADTDMAAPSGAGLGEPTKFSHDFLWPAMMSGIALASQNVPETPSGMTVIPKSSTEYNDG
jgi:hypothetical protein